MVKKYKQSDYPDRELEACKRVMMEIVSLFKEYSDHIALIGGWVPYYLIPQNKIMHIGSLDIDICFDLHWISEARYESILNILKNNGYFQTSPTKPFQWWKQITIDDSDPINVEVDLLSAEYGGRGINHENQNIQENIKARKARGSDLIFDEHRNRFSEIVLEGRLPNGAKDSIQCKIAGVVPFLVMKGMAIGRGKPKDAYDIEYVIANYPGGKEGLIAVFKQEDENNGLIKEGLGKIRTKFESVEHTGPHDVATFLEITEPEERAIRQRRAFEIVSEFLDALDIEKVVK